MKFPSIGEIATTTVVSISIEKSIADAIKMLFESPHRNIIVIDGDIFRILTVNDILNIKVKEIDLKTPLKDLNLAVVQTAHKDKNILHIVDYLNCEIEYICITDDDDSLYGIVSHTDITSSIDPDTLMSSLCLDDFLKLSKRSKWINKEIKTIDLLSDMMNKNYDSVIVVEKQKPIGIFTTKDVINLIKKSRDLEFPISEYMSSPVETIHRNSSVKNALEFLKNKHYKRVVVVDDNGNMSGIITQKELISLSYSRWAILMKEHHEELKQINASL
jgi:predicted transcriptional regulator